MNDTCKHGRLLESFYIDPDDWEPCKDCLIESLRKDTIKVSELRDYLEKKLKRLSILRSMDYHYYKKFTDELLAKFCEVKE